MEAGQAHSKSATPGRPRQDGGETPTSAATKLTHSSPGGNSHTSSCLAQIPLLHPDVWPLLQEALLNCILPSSWHGFSPTPASRPDFLLLQDMGSAQGPGQAWHSPVAHRSMGMGVATEKSSPVPLGPISPVDKNRKRLAWKDQVLNLGPEDCRMKPPLYFFMF